MNGEKKGRVRYDEGVINSAGTEIVFSLREKAENGGLCLSWYSLHFPANFFTTDHHGHESGIA